MNKHLNSLSYNLKPRVIEGLIPTAGESTPDTYHLRQYKIIFLLYAFIAHVRITLSLKYIFPTSFGVENLWG